MATFLAHFSPWTGLHQPCWQCTRFVRMLYGGTAAECSLPNAPKVRSAPANGCSGWMRETGSDDEPGPPPHAPPQ